MMLPAFEDDNLLRMSQKIGHALIMINTAFIIELILMIRN